MADVFNSIEQDFLDLQKAIHNAKIGRWEIVWNVLSAPQKRQLDRRKLWFLNCIPENRRWGFLHQAVYWRATDVIKYLLSIRSCDTNTKTKWSSCYQIGVTNGLTASQLAKQYNYEDIERLIGLYTNEPVFASIDTFKVINENDKACNLPLITYTIVSYKNTFHPYRISRNDTLLEILIDIYEDLLSSKDMWIAVMNKTCDSLESVKEEVSLDLKRKSVSKECFFAGIINTYTNEATYLYTDLNTALRRQTLGYCPASDDLALGPYIVIYQLLLLFWDELEKESQQTYRRMILCDKDVAKYKKGVKFSWQCFVSSTIDKHCATPFPTRAPLKGDHRVLFIINNESDSSWKPRNIEKYAHSLEKERVYPAGARFIVTSSQRMINKRTCIRLSLLDDDNRCKEDVNMIVGKMPSYFRQYDYENLRGRSSQMSNKSVWDKANTYTDLRYAHAPIERKFEYGRANTSITFTDLRYAQAPIKAFHVQQPNRPPFPPLRSNSGWM